MPGTFYVTGLIIPSNTGRSFKVYTLEDDGSKVFIGLISRKALSCLLQKQIFQADICKFSSVAAQEQLGAPT
jgi:hypothetical protein